MSTYKTTSHRQSPQTAYGILFVWPCLGTPGGASRLSIVRASIKAQSTAAHGTCGSVECSFFDSFDVGHQLLAGPVDLPRPIHPICQSHGLFGQFRFDSGTVCQGFHLIPPLLVGFPQPGYYKALYMTGQWNGFPDLQLDSGARLLLTFNRFLGGKGHVHTFRLQLTRTPLV